MRQFTALIALLPLLALTLLASMMPPVAPPRSAMPDAPPARMDVSATDGVFEDRTEITWPDTTVASAFFKIERDGALLAVVPVGQTFYHDRSGDAFTSYDYCVSVSIDGVDTVLGCDTGFRAIFAPTDMEATDQTLEDQVFVSWVDRSEIEDSYALYRRDLAAPDSSLLETLAPDAVSYSDDTATPGVEYRYCVVAADDDGAEAEAVCDLGTRAFVTPPGNVVASDGQYPNFVRIAWADLSTGEDGFNIYREGTEDPIGAVPADSTVYHDSTAVLAQVYQYCVTSVTEGIESVRTCNNGRRGGLAAPEEVLSLLDAFDDRVELTWTDPGVTEDGFEVVRWVTDTDIDTLLATLGAGVSSFDDRDATQGVDYTYCVRAFSNADPEATSFSDDVCAEGRRSVVLAPDDVDATDGDFEEKVELSWTNPSTTTMLVNLYRDDTLIQTVPVGQTLTFDFTVDAEVAHAYCLSNMTVFDATAAEADAVTERLRLRGAGSGHGLQGRPLREAAEAELAEAYRAATGFAPEIVESARTCDAGTRSLHAPLSVQATFDEFEDHVQVTWVDESEFEKGYRIYRAPDYAVDFNGTTGSYAFFVPSFAGGSLSAFTAAFWMKNRGNQPDATLISYNVTDDDDQIVLRNYNDFEVWIGGAMVAQTGVSAKDGRWHHIALTWDNTAGALALYKDGVLAYEATGLQVGVTIPSGGIFNFGRDFLGGAFDGSMNEAQLWDVARTPVEIQQGWDRSPEGTEPGLIGSWPLTEGTGGVGNDRVGGQDLTLVGASWAEGSAPFSGDEIGDVSATRASFGDYTGMPGMNYRYAVRAYDAYGESALGSDAGRRILSAPTGLMASFETFETKIELTWSDNSTAEDGYRLWRDDGGGSVLIATTAASVNTYVDPTTIPGVTYTYTVRAFDAEGESDPDTDEGRAFLLAPVSVHASDIYDDRVEINWIDVSVIESGYRVTRSDGGVSVNLPANTAVYTDLTAVPGTTYTYCVEATKTGGGASASVCDDGLIPGPPPDDLPVQTLQRQLPMNGRPDQPTFGRSVALSEDLAYIGSTGVGPIDGYSYIFTRENDVFTLVETIPGDGTETHGFDVDVDGNYLIVGTPWYNTGQGWVSTYQYDNDTRTYLGGVSGFTNNDSESNYGAAVAIREVLESEDGNLYAVAGDPSFLNGVGVVTFSSYDGTDWQFGQFLFSTDDQNDAYYGAALDFDEEHLLVGLPGWTSDQGQVEAYTFNPSSDQWDTPSLQIDGPAGTGAFGTAIAVENGTALIGAPGLGQVLIYTWTGSTWTLDTTIDGDGFGFGTSIAMEGGFAIVGNPNAQSGRGSATVLKQTDAGWAALERVVAENAAPGDSLGTSVALNSGTALIGAIGADGLTESGNLDANTGAVYVHQVFTDPTLAAASDGTYENRVRVSWEDNSNNEKGFRIFRDGEEIAETTANITSVDDFEIPAGLSATYCVEAFGEAQTTSAQVCDIGWRPRNGFISGTVSAALGGGTRDAEVCLTPNPNQGLLFDGEDGHLRSQPMTLPNGELTALTVAFWMKTTDSGATTPFSYATPSATNSIVFINPNDPNIHIANSAAINLDVLGALNTGVWKHVAFSWDTGGDLNFYIDGVLIRPYTNIQNGETIGTDGILILGQEQDAYGGGFDEDQAYEGQLDEVSLWERVLTIEEIQALMVSQTTGGEDGLVGAWAFDQGTGNTAPDLAGHGNNLVLEPGSYWAEQGAPLSACAVTDVNGNYAIDNILYGVSTEFSIRPEKGGRTFIPAVKTLVLSPDNPVQNEIHFGDISAFTVSGLIQYEGTVCPVPDVELYVGDIIADNLKDNTEADGSYAVAVDPPSDENDTRTITPRLTNHLFSPASVTSLIEEDLFDVNFVDETSGTLRGFFGGSCGIDIGTATIKVFTEDGCFEQEFENVQELYAFDLPPQKYLIEVVDVQTDNDNLRADILAYFDDLGAQEVDLTKHSGIAFADTLDLVYHAPVSVAVAGLPDPPAACSAITQVETNDEGVVINTLRSLPAVPVLYQGEELQLTLTAFEDFGDQQCPVEEGTITVFDAIADGEVAVEALTLEDGSATYSTVVGTPNIFTRRAVDGTDRSLQKSLTVVAEVPNVSPTTETVWAMVEGDRDRTGTFVTAATAPMDLLVVHDPPGSNSYSYMEKGTGLCTTMTDITLKNNGAGLDIDLNIGAKGNAGADLFGVTFDTGFGGAFVLRTRIFAGKERENIDSGFEMCVTTTERFATSDSDTWVGEDIFVGTGLNLEFSERDVLAIDPEACTVELSETLGASLDETEPFHTTFVYGASHIGLSLIPALDNLIELAGEDGESASVPDSDETFQLKAARDGWQDILDRNDEKHEEAVFSENFKENRSFSSGADYEHVILTEETTVNYGLRETAFVDLDVGIGGAFTIADYDSYIVGITENHWEWTSDSTSVSDTTSVVGYVLSDGDTGDFYSVDVATDPESGTPMFNIVSGRTSNPWQSGTQQRDVPILEVSPPVQFDVSPDEPAIFNLSLTNGSESQEQREYILDAIREVNPGSAVIGITGDPIGEERFVIDANETLNVTLAVERGPQKYRYDSLAVYMYPQKEFEIWQADPRQPFALSDTVYFSVHFTPPCSPVSLLRPDDYWGFKAGDDPLELIIHEFSMIEANRDTVQTVGVEYRLDGQPDWLEAFSAARGTLGDDATSATGDWTPPQDGPYELRGFTSCDVGGTVYSEAISGTVDTKAPKVLGNPGPGDGVLGLGADITLAFDEPVDCATVIDNGVGQNVVLTYLDGDEAGTAIPAEAVCSGSELVLTPTGGLDGLEGRFLQAQVGGLTDLVGNPLETTTWSFTVLRSGFAWQPVNVEVDVSRGSETTVTTSLANGRTHAVDFTLAPTLDLTPQGGGDVVALTPSVTTGSIVAGGTKLVRFTLPDTLTLGTYEGSIMASATHGGEALGEVPFYLTTNVVCIPPPDWTVTPSLFQYSMAVTARLVIDGIPSSDPNDVIAAYVGEEVRGVASVEEVTTGAFLANMLVHSNSREGELVTFRVWDDSDCRPYAETSRTLVFEDGAAVGSFAQPTTLEAPPPVIEQAIPLASGWTWFSLNTDAPDASVNAVLGDLDALSGDIVKNQTSFALYDENFGWVGPLAALETGVGYQVNLGQSNNLVLTGPPTDPTAPLSLDAGWNWIGYLPQTDLPINDALSISPTPLSGDLIKSQFGFAEYVSGTGWLGSLTTMEPGLGYLIQVDQAGTLTYPAASAATAPALAADAADAAPQSAAEPIGATHAHDAAPKGAAPDRTAAHAEAERTEARQTEPRKETAAATAAALAEAKTTGPDWTLDARRFGHTMTLIAEVDGTEERPRSAASRLAVLAGDVVRGVAVPRYVPSLERTLYFLLIYGAEDEPDPLTLRFYDAAEDRVYETGTTLTFAPDAAIGRVGAPVVLRLDAEAEAEADGAVALPEIFALESNYPNPFNPVTTIRYALPEAAHAVVEVFDMVGRRVAVLVNKPQQPGHYEVAFDAGQLASGVYLYRMKAGTFTEVRRMVLLK